MGLRFWLMVGDITIYCIIIIICKTCTWGVGPLTVDSFIFTNIHLFPERQAYEAWDFWYHGATAATRVQTDLPVHWSGCGWEEGHVDSGTALHPRHCAVPQQLHEKITWIHEPGRSWLDSYCEWYVMHVIRILVGRSLFLFYFATFVQHNFDSYIFYTVDLPAQFAFSKQVMTKPEITW